MKILDENSIGYLSAYNREARGQRYNRIARAVYAARKTIGNPLSLNFERHLITGLKGFDMARTMRDGFADRFRHCLDGVRTESAFEQARCL